MANKLKPAATTSPDHHARTGAARTTTPEQGRPSKPRTAQQITAEQYRASDAPARPRPTETLPVLLRATVATINMDKLDHWLKMPTIDFSFHGNDGRFPGMDGDIPAGSEFVVLPSTAEDGFIRFFGEGAAPDERMSSLGDDTPIITREELGDLDPKKWPPGLDDQPQDPWQKQMKIAMVDRNGNDIYRFVAHNMVSIIAVRQLLGRIRFNPKGKAGWLPVIRLGVVEYFNKKYRCKKPKPVLGVVDWIAPDADGSAVPASPSTDNNRGGRLPPSGSEEFTDEILF